MKKLYLLLFFVFCLNSYVQAQASYDIVIAYERQPTDDKNEEFHNHYSVSNEYLGFCLTDYQGNVIGIKSSDNIGNNYIDERPGYGCCFKMPNSSQTTFLNYKNVPVYGLHANMFTVIGISVKLFDKLPASVVDDGGDSFEFDEFINPGKSQLLLETYMGNFYVQSFKPNVNIFLPANRDPANGTKTICANEQFGVQAFPQGFPPEIYNWQYSLDNKNTWRDVPEEFHVDNPNFTISDLLGSNHLNYIGKTLYFRMGYNSMVFAGGLEFPLLYSACAPLVNNVEYLAPLCYGENVRDVTVTFDRDLYSGEELHNFQLKAVNTSNNLPDGTPPIVYPFFVEGDPKNGLITKFDEKSPGIYSYSMSNFRGLNPNATYQIRYQAFENSKDKGLGISDEELNFKYTEPEPLTFKIIEANNPICADEPVEVSVSVSGGNGNYKFYVDGIEKTNPKPVKETDGYYHIRGLIPTAVNSIKVMDENDCIEKTP